MNNYLLSIDPSIKNTGLTLWENKKPIWINNYMEFIHNIILNKFNGLYWEQLSLCIEQGFINKGKGKETLEHLRGFIAGWFNKLITKDMLVHNLTWKKWYKNRTFGAYWDIKNEKWTKETSLAMAQIIISENEWDFNITNHDEADSLLIGWYYLNKE
ncbi:hypothetical protein [Spiroplasma ixodetis]|uniref:Uncharacterized protein n=1 Tax=Spiroplasma ixodetis TaxID=2141 RepID=A0ABM8JRS2_9MOLU